jgi:hypothetical protein
MADRENGMKPLLIMSNVDPDGDELLFHNDVGSWNVSRALLDCKLGKHKPYLIDVTEAYEANKEVELDEAKVAAFMAMPEFLKTTALVGIIEDGMALLIDGHHRLRAMHRLGIRDFGCYIIEEAHAAPYQVLYNGQRKPPFKPY